MVGCGRPERAVEVPVDEVYGHLGDMGIDYGPAFQGLRRSWRRDGEVFCEVSLGDELLTSAGSFGVHPALLDAALHASVLLAGEQDGGAVPRLPFSWSDIRIGVLGASWLRVRLKTVLDGSSGGEASGVGVLSLVAFDDEGALVVSVGSLVGVRCPLSS